MILKLSVIILLLSIMSFSFAQDFTIEKVTDIYKTENYRKIVRNEDYIFASGERALHLLTNDENGNLITIDELPLWGDLALDPTPGANSIEIIGNYAYLFGKEYGSSIRTRLYRILINNESLTLVDSVNFYDEIQIRQVLGVNGHLFVIPFYSTGTLHIYDNDNFDVVAEYNIPSLFHDNEFYKINDQYLYTWDDQVESLMHIYDVSDVCAIQEIAEIDFIDVFPDIPIGLPVMINDTTLCMCNPEMYSIIDISNIFDWQLLSTIEFTGEPALNNLAVLDEERIIIPYTNGSVGLYDISNIEEPSLLSTQDYTSSHNLSECVCFDNYYYQVDDGFGIHQFNIIDDQFEYLGIFPEFSIARYTYIHNDLLAVRTFYWRGMHFFDISDFNNIQHTCTHFDDYIIYGCDFEDNYLAVPLSSFPENINSIDIYDISNIEIPFLVNKIENTLASEVYLEYPYLYSREAVPYSSEHHFVKYDISEPFNPHVIYDFELSPHMFGYFKYGDYVYYRGGDDIINILGNLDGDYPEVVATLEIDGLIAFWPMKNDAMVVLKNNPINELYSLENPLEPEFLFDYPYTSENFRGGIEENLFFQGGFSINVFDIENGYNMYESIYSFEMPYKTSIRYFLEKDGEDYVLFQGVSGISLYRYDYDNTFIFENVIHSNSINFSNYPNPFNPETNIVFNLPQAGEIKIDIYNIKGQKIKSLLSGQITAGEHSIVWNGENASGKKVGSGVYLYKLVVDGRIEAVKKCLLLK